MCHEAPETQETQLRGKGRRSLPVRAAIQLQHAGAADLVSRVHALCYVLCKLSRLLEVGGRERALVERRDERGREAHAFCSNLACGD